jgi:hypothetical protein
MATPSSVKAYGGYRRPPLALFRFEVTICDLKEANSSHAKAQRTHKGRDISSPTWRSLSSWENIGFMAETEKLLRAALFSAHKHQYQRRKDEDRDFYQDFLFGCLSRLFFDFCFCFWAFCF